MKIWLRKFLAVLCTICMFLTNTPVGAITAAMANDAAVTETAAADTGNEDAAKAAFENADEVSALVSASAKAEADASAPAAPAADPAKAEAETSAPAADGKVPADEKPADIPIPEDPAGAQIAEPAAPSSHAIENPMKSKPVDAELKPGSSAEVSFQSGLSATVRLTVRKNGLVTLSVKGHSVYMDITDEESGDRVTRQVGDNEGLSYTGELQAGAYILTIYANDRKAGSVKVTAEDGTKLKETRPEEPTKDEPPAADDKAPATDDANSNAQPEPAANGDACVDAKDTAPVPDDKAPVADDVSDDQTSVEPEDKYEIGRAHV